MKILEYSNILILCIATITLVALQVHILGYALLALGFTTLWLCSKDFRRHIGLVYACVALLGIAPINTSTQPAHVFQLGIPMALVLGGTYFVTRKLYKNDLVKFNFNWRRKWSKKDIFYFFFIIFAAYLILPIILKTGDSYLNWSINSSTRSLVESFLGLNAVAIWEELFFVCTIFTIFKRFLPLHQANIAQAVLFTSFLYNIGFQGWCPILVFIFALSQGYMYNRTNSLAYLLAVHLSLDIVVHLSLVNLHNPQLVPYFIT